MPFVCHLPFNSDLWAPHHLLALAQKLTQLPSLPYAFYRNTVLMLLKTKDLKPFLCNNKHFSCVTLHIFSVILSY